MGENIPGDPETERAIASANVERALATQEETGVKLGNIFTDMGKSLAKALGSGFISLGQGVVDVRDEIKDVGEGIDETMDDVIGGIVDPIRKGLNAVVSELTGEVSLSMAAGLIVGAVVAMRDKILEGLDWLWNDMDLVLEAGWDLIKTGLKEGWELLKAVAPHVLEGLVILGDTILNGLSAGWEFFKTDIAPEIVDGVKALGKIVWDYIPDWLQSGLEVVGSIAAAIGSLGADIGSFVMSGLEKLLRGLGLDTLADAVGYLSDVLDALAEWLGAEKGPTVGEKAAVTKRRMGTPEGIQAEGTEKQKAVYAEVAAAGGTPHMAAGLGALAEPGREAEIDAAMTAFRGAVEAGATATDARRMAMMAYNKTFREGRRGAAAKPVGGAEAGGMGGVVAERASEIATARETNNNLRKMVALTERADREKAGEGNRQEALDTVSSADELGVFPAGRMAGGMVP